MWTFNFKFQAEATPENIQATHAIFRSHFFQPDNLGLVTDRVFFRGSASPIKEAFQVAQELQTAGLGESLEFLLMEELDGRHNFTQTVKQIKEQILA